MGKALDIIESGLKVVTHPAFYWPILSLIVVGLIVWIASYFIAAHQVYIKTLKRNSKEQWGRDYPSELEERSVKMYQTGISWAEQNAEFKKDVHIVNNGLNLYGEYYDFGTDKCVMILSGRTEALKYGYYFAIPYHSAGYNVLVVDPRGHGLSDGEYNTVGFEESKDAIAWVNMLKEKFGVKSVIFHGICIGAAGGMLAITSKDCPDIVSGIVTEGMFPNFSESMKNNLKERRKPVFIMLDLINAQMKKHTGHSMKIGPIDYIDALEKPLLMLHSREDKFSKPDMAQKLFDKTKTTEKEIVWFDHGDHSMLRITDTERYDNAIKDFLRRLK